PDIPDVPHGASTHLTTDFPIHTPLTHTHTYTHSHIYIHTQENVHNYTRNIYTLTFMSIHKRTYSTYPLTLTHTHDHRYSCKQAVIFCTPSFCMLASA